MQFPMNRRSFLGRTGGSLRGVVVAALAGSMAMATVEAASPQRTTLFVQNGIRGPGSTLARIVVRRNGRVVADGYWMYRNGPTVNVMFGDTVRVQVEWRGLTLAGQGPVNNHPERGHIVLVNGKLRWEHNAYYNWP